MNFSLLSVICALVFLSKRHSVYAMKQTNQIKVSPNYKNIVNSQFIKTFTLERMKS